MRFVCIGLIRCTCTVGERGCVYYRIGFIHSKVDACKFLFEFYLFSGNEICVF